MIFGLADTSTGIYHTLESAVINFLIHGQYAEASSKDMQLVEYGIGRYEKIERNGSGEDCIVINENLVMAALCTWANTTRNGHHPLRAWIDTYHMKSMGNSTRGDGLEYAMEYLVWDWFSDEGSILSDVFDFQSESPSWAKARAKLIGTFKWSAPGGSTVIQEKAKTVGLARKADDSLDSMAWFLERKPDDLEPPPPVTFSEDKAIARARSRKKKARSKPKKKADPLPHDFPSSRRFHLPILRPDHLFGPDLILGLELDPTGIEGTGLTGKTEILLCIQCKNLKNDNGFAAMEKVIWRLSPDGWWRDGQPVCFGALKRLR